MRRPFHQQDDSLEVLQRGGTVLPIGVLGGGVWGQVQMGGGGAIPVENEGKGRGGWGK